MFTRRLLTCRKASQQLQGAAEVLIVRKPPPDLQAEGSRPSASQRRCGSEGVSKTFLASLLEKRRDEKDPPAPVCPVQRGLLRVFEAALRAHFFYHPHSAPTAYRLRG